MMRRLRTFLHDSRGAAAAEMALMLPLLVVLLFVTFEGGYFLWNEHKVVKGVRDGARYAGRLDFSIYDCTGGAIDDEDFEANIKNLTRTGQLTGGTPVIAGWQDDDTAIAVDCAAGQGGLYGANAGVAPRVTISAAVPYPSSPLSDLVGVLGFDTSSINLRATAQSPVMGL
jgi:Flp pilus assembly protein TadG